MLLISESEFRSIETVLLFINILTGVNVLLSFFYQANGQTRTIKFIREMMTMIMNSSSKCVGIDAICFCMICTYELLVLQTVFVRLEIFGEKGIHIF